MTAVLQLVAYAGAAPPTTEIGFRCLSHEGRFVVSFDYEAEDLDQVLVTTDDLAQAMRFPTAGEAFDYWRQEHGLRADGKPNRPLTAYTAAVETIRPTDQGVH